MRAGFYAEIVTHEQKFDALSLEEWDRILSRTDALTEGYEKIYAGHDAIGRYLKAKDGVWIAGATVEGGRLRCALAGRLTAPLRLSVFHDDGDAVRREYRTVDAFEGEVEIG